MKKEISIVAVFIILDQIIKSIATGITQPISIIGDFVQLNYVKNFGVAWSMFNNQMGFIIAISTAAIVYLIYILRQYREYAVIHFGILMMISGAFGNIIDRVVRGFVVDYVDITIFGYDYPIFNFADTLLVCGIIVIFIDSLRKVKHGETV